MALDSVDVLKQETKAGKLFPGLKAAAHSGKGVSSVWKS